MRSQADVWICEYKDCRHVWLCGDKTEAPEQCSKCRRRHWHGQKPVTTEQKRVKRPAEPEPKVIHNWGARYTTCGLPVAQFKGQGVLFRDWSLITCDKCLDDDNGWGRQSKANLTAPVQEEKKFYNKPTGSGSWYCTKTKHFIGHLNYDPNVEGATCDFCKQAVCEVCETNPRSDKRPNGTCDECQERLEKWAVRSEAGVKAWKNRKPEDKVFGRNWSKKTPKAGKRLLVHWYTDTENGIRWSICGANDPKLVATEVDGDVTCPKCIKGMKQYYEEREYDSKPKTKLEKLIVERNDWERRAHLAPLDEKGWGKENHRCWRKVDKLEEQIDELCPTLEEYTLEAARLLEQKATV